MAQRTVLSVVLAAGLAWLGGLVLGEYPFQGDGIQWLPILGGAGLGAAIAARLARPSSQVVLLLGDGAAGFSLMDVDTLVRHDLPVVMVMGNNSAWGLEKGPMQMLYGYDVVADLAPRTAYDEVVKALGGGGELVTRPGDIGPALDRARASGVPYLVNVITDVDAAYPRSTFGI